MWNLTICAALGGSSQSNEKTYGAGIEGFYPTPEFAQVQQVNPNSAYASNKRKCVLVATMLQLYRFLQPEHNPFSEPLRLFFNMLGKFPYPPLPQP